LMYGLNLEAIISPIGLIKSFERSNAIRYIASNKVIKHRCM
jgi:hypothetical protein